MSHLVAEAKHNRKLENIIPAIVVFLPMALNHLYSEQRQQILGVLLELLSSFPCTSHWSSTCIRLPNLPWCPQSGLHFKYCSFVSSISRAWLSSQPSCFFTGSKRAWYIRSDTLFTRHVSKLRLALLTSAQVVVNKLYKHKYKKGKVRSFLSNRSDNVHAASSITQNSCFTRLAYVKPSSSFL